MEPSTVMRDHVLNPTAIYSKIGSWDPILSEVENVTWQDSYQNPKNRIESLVPEKSPSWQLDGIDSEGVRFFAYPISAIGKPPLRIDVYIPGQQDHPPALRRVLRSSSTPFIRSDRAAELELCQHIMRALQHWSARTPDFEAMYFDLPFGSRVVVNDISANVATMDIQLVARYNNEQNWFSLKVLEEMWALDPVRWPDVVDFDDLQLQSQPHESITLVRIPSRRCNETVVFKSLVQDTKYMYHELKMLLTLERHPNISSPPLYIVTKKCRFGGKVGVCGFILPFYLHGSLVKALNEPSTAPLETRAYLKDRFRWATQITKALIHINKSPLGFYPDLKPDNVLLVPPGGSDTGALDALLIDFEQRGGWYSWSPPEVRYIEYMEYITARMDCRTVRKKSLALLTSFIPTWKLPTQSDRYTNCERGFSSAWATLETHELEAAQVFMLGKLLWCLFEGTSSIKCGISFDMLRDEEGRQFPEFQNTPTELRDCIRECTSGAPEWEGRFRTIGRLGTKYYAVERLGRGDEILEEATPQETQDAAARWWKEEVRSAKRYVQQKINVRDGKKNEDNNDIMIKVEIQARQRPRLESILVLLEKAEAEHCTGN
jgi:hypothetical protein